MPHDKESLDFTNSGPLPITDGLSSPGHLAYLSLARARPALFRACGALRTMTEVTSPPQRTPAISFEFFPPKTGEMERNLWEAINRLAPLSPNFVSVTYGAGGSTRERTHSTIARILTETSLTPAAHLTCVGAARGEIDEIVDRYHDVGVRHMVALRGDPATGIGTP